ncbi:MAG: glutaredoxin family protein [Thermoleophilia bacterium]|nr:glutaredoxin family protein [Thermoleophilia bacterium]
MKLVIYTRPGCHLCEEAIAAAEVLIPRFGFSLHEVNIELDDQLHRRYLEAIPVIEVDGRERLRLDGHRHGGLERALEQARSARDGMSPGSY